MKKIINDEFLTENNIHIENELMPNGEKRFRIKWSDIIIEYINNFI